MSNPGAIVALSLLFAAPLVAQEPATEHPAVQAVPARCFLWKVTDDAGEGFVYVLGSFHSGTPDLFPLDRAIEEAYEACRILAVEIDPANVTPDESRALILRYGAYNDGTTMADHLTPEAFDVVRQKLEAEGIPLQRVGDAKPSLVQMNLRNPAIVAAGFSADFGLDRHFLTRAREDKKQILELETVESQYALIFGDSDELQELSLLRMIRKLDSIKEDTQAQLTAWRNGDADAMEQIMTGIIEKDPWMEASLKKRLDDRNGPFAEKTLALLEAGEPALVVLGAAHLVGERGVLAQLQERGLTVEQVAGQGAPAPADSDDLTR